jgi:hypothetical protein
VPTTACAKRASELCQEPALARTPSRQGPALARTRQGPAFKLAAARTRQASIGTDPAPGRQGPALARTRQGPAFKLAAGRHGPGRPAWAQTRHRAGRGQHWHGLDSTDSDPAGARIGTNPGPAGARIGTDPAEARIGTDPAGAHIGTDPAGPHWHGPGT